MFNWFELCDIQFSSKAFELVIHPPDGFSTSHFGFFEGSRARHKIHHAQITCSLTLKINRVGHHCQSSAFEQALCAGHVVGRGDQQHFGALRQPLAPVFCFLSLFFVFVFCFNLNLEPWNLNLLSPLPLSLFLFLFLI